MPADLRPIETPLPQRLLHFRQRTLPLVIWSMAALIVVSLLLSRARRYEYVGLAQAHEYEISSAVTGVLHSVAVELYDRVEAGDVVARLEDSQLRATIETANATVRKLTADLNAASEQLDAERGRGMADWTADLRRFQIDEESRRLEALKLRVQIESDEVELERVSLELRRLRPQMDAGLISDSQMDNVQARHDQILTRVQENKVLLEQTESEHQVAQHRRREYESKLPRTVETDSLLEPLRQAIEIEQRKIEEIETERAALVLRSPVSGQVSQLLCRKGQSVMRGEPIAMIADRSVQEILAYVRESDEREIGPRTQVLISSATREGPLAESMVIRVAPTVDALPQRLWPDPRVPAYGRAVVIAATPSMQLVPGELVRVDFQNKK